MYEGGLFMNEKNLESDMNRFSVKIGKMVLARRKELRMSQRKLAEKANTSQKAIYYIETAKNNVTVETLNRVFDVLGLHSMVAIYDDE
jgi:predicted transcriptional regulator